MILWSFVQSFRQTSQHFSDDTPIKLIVSIPWIQFKLVFTYRPLSSKCCHFGYLRSETRSTEDLYHQEHARRLHFRVIKPEASIQPHAESRPAAHQYSAEQLGVEPRRVSANPTPVLLFESMNSRSGVMISIHAIFSARPRALSRPLLSSPQNFRNLIPTSLVGIPWFCHTVLMLPTRSVGEK